ncbi:hypothetical protein ACQP00_39440 [Dactylosporangium sp. CS-047395]|uniref:hypothetical protein n=1 Tax=Dactylosporangium sp. CS-047395 TaxID=3239936 RepID=UPI003D91928F
MTDDTLTRIGTAVERGRSGHRAEAREALTLIWSTLAADDNLHRCALAHYLADLQDDPAAELEWDERALEASTGLPTAQAASFLPSLHLNLADVHRRLDHPARAREHLALARAHEQHLPDDDYGAMIRGGIRHLGDTLGEVS